MKRFFPFTLQPGSRLIRTGALVLAWLALIVCTVSAQASSPETGWSPQQRIPDYGNESRPPFLVTGQDGVVFAFNTQPDGPSSEAIFVRRWSLQQSWSPPVDILLSPLPGAPVMEGAYQDPEGIIHLIFFAGNEVYGAIYYTWAPAYLADDPLAWSKPILIGDDSLGIGSALAGDGHGSLFVIFGGRQDGIGLYGTFSTDHGKNWSAPRLITLMEDSNLLPNGTQVVVDSQDRVHLVWSEVDQTGIDLVVYYSRLEVGQKDWSQPVALARRDVGDYKAAWPSIISYKDELMLIYQDSSPATRWMRLSSDGGKTWTDPVRPWPHQGEYSQADLLVDSKNVLHIILGNRNGECCHGMWHGVWLGDHWGALEPIVMGPKTLQFDPSAPRSIIAQGNVLLATWWTDTGGGPRNGAWYSYSVLDAPQTPSSPLPQPMAETKQPIISATSLTSLPPTETPVPTPTNIDRKQLGVNFAGKPSSTNPGIPVVAGLLPAGLLVVGLFILRLIHTNSK